MATAGEEVVEGMVEVWVEGVLVWVIGAGAVVETAERIVEPGVGILAFVAMEYLGSLMIVRQNELP